MPGWPCLGSGHAWESIDRVLQLCGPVREATIGNLFRVRSTRIA